MGTQIKHSTPSFYQVTNDIFNTMISRCVWANSRSGFKTKGLFKIRTFL